MSPVPVSYTHLRMLNLGKGPAVHSLRAQIDRREYSKIMKHKLELQENMQLKQAEIVEHMCIRDSIIIA